MAGHGKKHHNPLIRTHNLQEKQLLNAIDAIFKNSDLLKGLPPPDSIFIAKPCPALLENLRLLDHAKAVVSKKQPATDNQPTKKSPSRKGPKL